MRKASLSFIICNHEDRIDYRKGYLPKTKLSLLILTNKELLTRPQLTRAHTLMMPGIAMLTLVIAPVSRLCIMHHTS